MRHFFSSQLSKILLVATTFQPFHVAFATDRSCGCVDIPTVQDAIYPDRWLSEKLELLQKHQYDEQNPIQVGLFAKGKGQGAQGDEATKIHNDLIRKDAEKSNETSTKWSDRFTLALNINLLSDPFQEQPDASFSGSGTEVFPWRSEFMFLEDVTEMYQRLYRRPVVISQEEPLGGFEDEENNAVYNSSGPPSFIAPGTLTPLQTFDPEPFDKQLESDAEALLTRLDRSKAIYIKCKNV
ncbi:unnamed protein product, partial [Amoebophrya sp. A120]|eukprot:GSA120T00023142001.1